MSYVAVLLTTSELFNKHKARKFILKLKFTIRFLGIYKNIPDSLQIISLKMCYTHISLDFFFRI